MHDPQHTYDLSGLALVTQGGPAVGSGGGCFYLRDDRRCAAGHLMTAPDDVLRALEGDLYRFHPWEVLRATGHDLELGRALQRAHDGAVGDTDRPISTMTQEEVDAYWRPRWLERVRRVARDFGLSDERVVAAARAAGWKVDP